MNMYQDFQLHLLSQNNAREKSCEMEISNQDSSFQFRHESNSRAKDLQLLS